MGNVGKDPDGQMALEAFLTTMALFAGAGFFAGAGVNYTQQVIGNINNSDINALRSVLSQVDRDAVKSSAINGAIVGASVPFGPTAPAIAAGTLSLHTGYKDDRRLSGRDLGQSVFSAVSTLAGGALFGATPVGRTAISIPLTSQARSAFSLGAIYSFLYRFTEGNVRDILFNLASESNGTTATQNGNGTSGGGTIMVPGTSIPRSANPVGKSSAGAPVYCWGVCN